MEQTEVVEIRRKIFDKLKKVYDPEIPINVVDLGLIYDVIVEDDNNITIVMTLTAPNCPEADKIPQKVEKVIEELNEINLVNVVITFDPPWDYNKLSEDVKTALGLF